MRPDSIFEWYDNSGITTPVTNTTIVAPLYLTSFSSEKGPEKIVQVDANDFYKYFGTNISFEKYGQPLVQAAHIIDNGGKLLCKRVVAEDSYLANIGIIAKVKSVQVQKTNSVGNALYTDAVTAQETTTSEGNTPIMINQAEISYDVYSVPECENKAKAKVEMAKLLDNEGTEDVFSYPLYLVTDNGRGVSKKRINIKPDRDVSKTISLQLYYLNVVGNDDYETEYTRFTLNPDTIYLDKSMSLAMTSKESLAQVEADVFEDATTAFVEKVADITGLTTDYLYSIDLLFGTDKKGNSIPQLSYKVSEDTYDITDNLGIGLLSGSNGSFGDKPVGTSEYVTALKEFFNGTFTDDIYDMNKYIIDAVFDADYPVEVKQAILNLAKFREDFFYFRDIGLGHTTYTSIMEAKSNLEVSKFAGTYITSYDVIDPYGKKIIPVTIMYSLAVKMIEHFNQRRNSPCCGIANGFTFPEAIEGTVNFCPKYTPNFDQKTEFADEALNYATYINDVLTLETELSSIDPYTHLSYINNILTTQEVIHAVRKACPSFRYSFITSNDLSEYKEKVNTVLSQFRTNFDSLTFEYTQDSIMAANKIFQASIKVSYRNFVQTEIFKIYSVSTN